MARFTPGCVLGTRVLPRARLLTSSPVGSLLGAEEELRRLRPTLGVSAPSSPQRPVPIDSYPSTEEPSVVPARDVDAGGERPRAEGAREEPAVAAMLGARPL